MRNWMFALFGLLLLSGAFAAGADANGTLGLKYGMMECEAAAVTGLVDYGQQSANVSGGSGLTGRINNDMATLKGYADTGDRQGFNTFVNGPLRLDMRDATLYLKDVRKEIVKERKGNETRDYFAEVRTTRAGCLQSTALGFARGQLDDIEKRVGNMNATVASLSGKGVDTAKLASIENEAEANMKEFQDAVAGGNASTLQDTARAIREEHLHIWARFEIEKAREILGAVQSGARAKGYGADVSSINTLLNDASGYVRAGNAYDPGEFDRVKADLVQVQAQLKELIKKTGDA